MTDEPTNREILTADRQEKEVELRRLKRRETPYLQAAADLGQLAPKIKTLEAEIADALESEVAA